MKLTKTTSVVGLCLFLASCSSVPVWVEKAPSAFKDCRDTICAYGIGEPSIKSLSLREETAETRGRAKVLEIIESRMKSVTKDIRAAEGDNTEKAIKSISEGSLSGVYLVDKYVKDDGTVYALMRLEPVKFKKIIEENKSISQETREFLRNRTEELLKSE